MHGILGAVVRAHTRCTLVRNLRSLPTSCFSTLLASKAMPPGVPPGEAVFFLRGEENMAVAGAIAGAPRNSPQKTCNSHQGE